MLLLLLLLLTAANLPIESTRRDVVTQLILWDRLLAPC